MKMMNILRTQKGMTLMELMVALLVVLILIPTISICLFSAMRQYAWTKSYADMIGIISTIDGTVERELSLADQPKIVGGAINFIRNGIEPTSMETRPVTLDGGTLNILHIGGRPVFDPTFYNDIGVTAKFDLLPEGGANVDAVLVTLTYSGPGNYTSTFLVRCR